MKPVVRTILQLLSFAALAVLAIYLFPKYHYVTKFEYEIDKPWMYNTLVADRDIPIHKYESQISEELVAAMKHYTPCFNLKDTTISSAVYVVSFEDYEMLKAEGCQQIAILVNKQMTRLNVTKLYTPKTAFQEFQYEYQPTLVFDSVMSQKLKDDIKNNVSHNQGMISAGTVIIENHQLVTAEIAQNIYSYIKEMDARKGQYKFANLSVLGAAICFVFLLLIFYFYLLTYRRKLLDNLRHVLFFTILMSLVVTASFAVLQYSANKTLIYMIPFVWCPIIARVFYDSRTAIFLHIITVAMVSLAVPGAYGFLLMQIAVGIVAVISLRDMTQRAQLAQTAAFVLLAYSVVYTALHVAQNGSINNVDVMSYVFFAVNAILVICAYGLIFLFERTFGLVSSITLVELTNVNSNLMLEFAEKAPGTFQHSLQVSNLATEAAKRIGAKVLLVRTGALYHDIGKMTNAEYFIENQVSGYNPLSGMDTVAAAKLVIDHVLEGERIARKHHLPEVIIHFIRSHHGTSQTRYFYNTALNQAKQDGLPASAVNAGDYTYPGPKPMTKEAAILMMADAIEARSRSLKEMTPQSISDMVDDMINLQMQDGQLAETPLSFKDLEDVRAVFKQKLLEINHHRITYPTVEEG